MSKHAIVDSNGRWVDVKPMSSLSGVVTTTTNVSVKAAVASKRHFVNQVILTNVTATEVTQINLQSATTSKMILGTADPVTASPAATVTFRFNPPVEFGSGEAINAKTIDATTGDIYVHINGYVEA